MNHINFDRLVEQETQRMKDVMCSKSADYSAADDKLFNFKLAAELDGISPIEALRGMWLKHRTSIRQGLDELLTGDDCRSEACNACGLQRWQPDCQQKYQTKPVKHRPRRRSSA